MRLGFREPAKICQGHPEKHPAFHRVGLQLPGPLQQLHCLLQMPASLERHRAGKKPRIKIPREFRANSRINPLCLVMLQSPMKGQRFLKPGGALFLIHRNSESNHETKKVQTQNGSPKTIRLLFLTISKSVGFVIYEAR